MSERDGYCSFDPSGNALIWTANTTRMDVKGRLLKAKGRREWEMLEREGYTIRPINIVPTDS